VEVDVFSLAAEFPNDNPALHRGVSWVCLDVTGAAVAIADALPVDEPALDPALERELEDIPDARISGIVGLGDTARDDEEADEADDEPIVVEDLPPLDETATLEGIELAPEAIPEAAPTTTIAPPPSDDPWLILVATLADVALGAGSPHVAAVLPGLLLDGTLEAMPDDAAQALAEANVYRGAAVTTAFVAQTRAWRGILLGTSDDFAACGNAMLDEWAADLLARLLGAPSRATALKRDLRSRGVAAFGLASAA
jgi:hypothetical protein